MRTVVIIGAGCSHGLAGLPLDTTFCKTKPFNTVISETRFNKQYFLSEAFRLLFGGNIGERLEVIWGEIDENFKNPKIILNTHVIDEFSRQFFKLAEEEQSEYKYYHEYFYRKPKSWSVYEYLFMFAGWELRKIVAEACSKPLNHEIREKYRSLKAKIDLLAEGTSVTYISFNYDTLLEQAVEQYCYLCVEPFQKDMPAVLKPHGSVNWMQRGNKAIIKLDDPLPMNKVGFKNSEIHQHSIIGLVPKKIEFNSSLQNELGFGAIGNLYGEKILPKIEESVGEAEQLIVIGYSFPFTDGHIRKAFMDSKPSLLKNIKLITNSETEALRISRIVSEIFSVENGRIETFCSGVEKWIE